MSGRVIVTGSRVWPSRMAVVAGLELVAEEFGLAGLTVVHGACPSGADSFAAQWARACAGHGVVEEPWPADWARHGRAAGPLRNRAMVAAGADLVLAFPLGRSAGTRGCMRLAESAGIPVRVVEL